MSKPDVLHLRYHHIDFIRYLSAISVMNQQVGFQMPEDYFGENNSQLQELSDHLVEWGDVPIVWVEGADYICSFCKYVDEEAMSCGGHTESDRDRTLLPEEIRRRADAETMRAYGVTDVERVNVLRDILKLKRKPVSKEI